MPLPPQVLGMVPAKLLCLRPLQFQAIWQMVLLIVDALTCCQSCTMTCPAGQRVATLLHANVLGQYQMADSQTTQGIDVGQTRIPVSAFLSRLMTTKSREDHCDGSVPASMTNLLSQSQILHCLETMPPILI